LETAKIPVLAVYVSRDGQTFGPFSWEEFWGHYQAGSVLGTDLAWYEGQPEWRFVQQMFVPAPAVAPMPVAVPAAASTPEARPVGPVGPLSYAGAEPHQLVDPLALSVPGANTNENPQTNPNPKKKRDPKAKGRIAGIRWQDIELPGWLKYAAPVAVVVLVYLVFGGPKWGPVDRTEQVIGTAISLALTGHKGELEDADLLKVSNLNLKAKLHTVKLVDGLSGPGGVMLSKCTGVVKLDLSNNKMTDLSRLAGMSKLEELYLSNNLINDFKPLEKLGSLKFLTIDGNPGASKSAEDALKRALPGITFSKKPK